MYGQISKRLHEPYKLFVTSGFRNMINLNYNDRRAKQLPELEIGQEVRNAPLQKNQAWKQATCVKKLSDRSHMVKSGDQTLRRNRQFLKHAAEPTTQDKQSNKDGTTYFYFKRRQGLHASRVHSCFVKSSKLYHRLGGEQRVEQKLSFTLLTQSNKHQTGYQCHLLRISAF